MSKDVLCSPSTDRHTHTHESENRGHPFMVSGIFNSTYHQGSVLYYWEQMTNAKIDTSSVRPTHFSGVGVNLPPKRQEVGRVGKIVGNMNWAKKRVSQNHCPSWITFYTMLDRSVMKGWWKKSLNPERVSSVVTTLCKRIQCCPCGDSLDIHGMRHIILGYFFPTITTEISTFHFRTAMIQVGYFFKNVWLIFIGPMKGVWWIMT